MNNRGAALLLVGAILLLVNLYLIIFEIEVTTTDDIMYMSRNNVYINQSLNDSLLMDFGLGNLLYLPDSAESLAVRNASRAPMFFITTDHVSSVRARYLCSAESAARLHPERDVYLLIADPPKYLNKSSNKAMLSLLQHYPNFYVLSLDMRKTFENSMFAHLYANNFNKTPYMKNVVSNLLRVMIVFKYGGTYLDCDIILLHRLDNSYNFVSAETCYEMTNSVINFVQKFHPVVLGFLVEMNNTDRLDKWGYLGPGSIQRVLRRHCPGQITDLIDNVCVTVTVLPTYRFFALKMLYHWYFDDRFLDLVRKKLERSVGIHLWNKVTSNRNVTLGSKQPLGLIAQNVCPYSYWSCESGIF